MLTGMTGEGQKCGRRLAMCQEADGSEGFSEEGRGRDGSK